MEGSPKPEFFWEVLGLDYFRRRTVSTGVYFMK